MEFAELTLDAVRASLRERGCAIGKVAPAEYHAWKHALGLPCVSKSSLLEFMRNPYAYRYRELLGIKKESSALSRGALIDCLTLTPDLFDKLYTEEEIDRRTKAGKARAEELAAAGITPVAPSEMEVAVLAATNAKEALSGLLGDAEGHAAYDTQVGMFVAMSRVGGVELATPLIVSGMLDICPDDRGHGLLDLKSTSVNLADAGEVNRNMCRFGYGVQAAMYCDLFEACTGEERGFAFLFVGAEPPCQVRYVGVDWGLLELYRSRYYEGLREYARAVAEDDWGDVALPPMSFEPPSWELKG